MNMCHGGFWCDAEFTNTSLLKDVARRDPRNTLSVLANPNITGEDLTDLAGIVRWTKSTVLDIGPVNLMQGRTAEDQYELVMHAARKSPVAVGKLLPYANTECLARLLAATQAGVRASGRVQEAWPALVDNYQLVNLDLNHPQYLTVLDSIGTLAAGGWLHPKFIADYAAGARTEEDDANVAAFIETSTHGMPNEWYVRELVTRLVLLTWDNPDRLLPWCAGSEVGTLIAASHPQTTADQLNGLLPGNNRHLPTPPVLRDGAADRTQLHARLDDLIDNHAGGDDAFGAAVDRFATYLIEQLAGPCGEGDLFDLLQNMDASESDWPVLRAAVIIDGNTATVAEKILLARRIDDELEVPGRLGELIASYAEMTLEDKLDQLAHLSVNTRRHLRSWDYLEDPTTPQADDATLIWTDEDAQRHDASVAHDCFAQIEDGVNRLRWPAAPWLSKQLRNVYEFHNFVAGCARAEKTLHEFVDEIRVDIAEDAEDKYATVLGDALGQL